MSGCALWNSRSKIFENNETKQHRPGYISPPSPSLVPIQSCHKDSWRLALQQWGGPALIAEEKAIFATDPPWEPAHQSVGNGGDMQGRRRKGGWWSQKPAWPRLRAGEAGGGVGEKNIGVRQRTRARSLRSAAACYHRIFLAVWRLIQALGVGRTVPREGVRMCSGRLCDMHFKRLYIQVVRGPDPPFWPVSLLNLWTDERNQKSVRNCGKRHVRPRAAVDFLVPSASVLQQTCKMTW